MRRYGLLGARITGTVDELVGVLVEFVFPSERDVTYLSNPRLMNTQETKFPICKELTLISIQYLPYKKSYLYTKRWANDGVVKNNPKKLASSCISCTRVLSADHRDIQIVKKKKN